MKRLLLMLALVCAFVLSSCGAQEAASDAAQDTQQQSSAIEEDATQKPDAPPAQQDEAEKGNETQTPPADKASQPEAETQNKETNTADNKQSKTEDTAKQTADNKGKSEEKPSGNAKQQSPAAVDAGEKQPAGETTVATTPSEEKKQTVTLSIRGSEATGTILSETQVEWEAGDTAFSVLKKITRANGIQMEFGGSGSSVYVEGIANLYEFDEGPTSGWMYRVNGEVISKSAGACELQPGDRVEWVYTLNLGKDLG